MEKQQQITKANIRPQRENGSPFVCNPVPNTLVSSIAQDLNLITCVDDYGVRQWLDIYPLPIFQDLKASHLVVLEEQDDTTSIGVRTEAVHQLRVWAWWVVTDFGSKEGLVQPIATIEGSLYVSLRNVGGPFVVIMEKEDIFPIKIFQLLAALAFQQIIQELHRSSSGIPWFT
ncbi:hypothetical protein SDJN02_05699, partial [Cucurbita argyrosperma subsp. argyrosperma]